MKARNLFLALLFVLTANAASAQELATRAFPRPMPESVAQAIQDASRQYGVDANLIASLAWYESAFNPNAVSRRGAEGIMQLKPRTARALGVQNSFDTRQNILGGTKYLRQLLDRFNGDVDLTLAAYNQGPEAVERKGARAAEYVSRVKAFYRVAMASR
ncbi:MAG TPA: transglycosylase SLT domain-containing protein [Thermoanaerobaculia bacterium]